MICRLRVVTQYRDDCAVQESSSTRHEYGGDGKNAQERLVL